MSMYDKKPLQYCKVISLQLIKINGKKNDYFNFCFLNSTLNQVYDLSDFLTY